MRAPRSTVAPIFIHHSLYAMKFSRTTRLPPVIITSLFTLLIAGCVNGNEDTPMPPAQDESSSVTMQSSEAAVVPKRKYRDGTFAADGDYRSPAGAEEVHVSLTLKNNVVVAAECVGKATFPKSVKMQAAFAAGFKEEVIGKPIDSLHLTVVNGSSLTSTGFMDAVAKIKAEAA